MSILIFLQAIIIPILFAPLQQKEILSEISLSIYVFILYNTFRYNFSYNLKDLRSSIVAIFCIASFFLSAIFIIPTVISNACVTSSGFYNLGFHNSDLNSYLFLFLAFLFAVGFSKKNYGKIVVYLWLIFAIFLSMFRIFKDSNILLALNPKYAIDLLLNSNNKLLLLSNVFIVAASSEIFWGYYLLRNEKPSKRDFLCSTVAVILLLLGRKNLNLENNFLIYFFEFFTYIALFIVGYAISESLSKIGFLAIKKKLLPKFNINKEMEIKNFINFFWVFTAIFSILIKINKINIISFYKISLSFLLVFFLIGKIQRFYHKKLFIGWKLLLLSVTYSFSVLFFISVIASNPWYISLLGALLILIVSLFMWFYFNRLEYGNQNKIKLVDFIDSVLDIIRVPGTSFYLQKNSDEIPLALHHNITVHQTLHSEVILINFDYINKRKIQEDNRYTINNDLYDFIRIDVKVGLLEHISFYDVLNYLKGLFDISSNYFVFTSCYNECLLSDCVKKIGVSFPKFVEINEKNHYRGDTFNNYE